MIEHLTLNNFRRHESLTVNFTQGVQVIRAANEGGKSTLLEAIGYALFGTKALRTSLDDTVTWGADVKTLKVELTVQSGGERYTFTRSKGGAEVVTGGKVFVTGQNEVSNFAAVMLGADAAVANKLMFASQGAIRGAIEEGPKPLSLLIEDLAGFSTFDTLMESAQNKLALGTPNLLEERLTGAKATMDAAMATLPPRPDEEEHCAKVTQLSNLMAVTEAKLPFLLKVAEDAGNVYLEKANKLVERMDLEKAVEKAKERVADAVEQMAHLKEDAAQSVDLELLGRLQRQIADAENHDRSITAYKRFLVLPTGDRFVGTEQEYEERYDFVLGEREKVAKRYAELRQELNHAKDLKIHDDKCDKCGQDITHLGSVVAANKKADAAIAALTPEIDATEKKQEALEKEFLRLKEIRGFALKYSGECKKIQEYVVNDISTHPFTASWNGSAPADEAPVAPYAEVRDMNLKLKAIDAAKAKYELATEQHAKAEATLKEARKALSKTKAPSLTEVSDAEVKKDAANMEYTVAAGNVELARQEIAALVKDHDHAVALWKSAQARIDDAQKVIDACNKDLASLNFNNALVKKLRAIRPMIANKLWTTVLASVSVMFSQMRGEESKVSKEKDGFRVNGQAIESLSGSTLDVLGIALRCSLLKTFIPQNGLLIADEPAQGCDEARTASLLGFLQGVGMSQILLVTHETISESIADNVIEV